MLLSRKDIGKVVAYAGEEPLKIEGFEREGGVQYVYGPRRKGVTVEGARPNNPSHPRKRYYAVNEGDHTSFAFVSKN